MKFYFLLPALLFCLSQIKVANAQSFADEDFYIVEDLSHSHFNNYGSPISLGTTQRKNFQLGLGQESIDSTAASTKYADKDSNVLKLASVYSLNDQTKMQGRFNGEKQTTKYTDSTTAESEDTNSLFDFAVAHNLTEKNLIGFSISRDVQKTDDGTTNSKDTVLAANLATSYKIDGSTYGVGYIFRKLKVSNESLPTLTYGQFYFGFGKKIDDHTATEFLLEHSAKKKKENSSGSLSKGQSTILTNKSILHMNQWQFKGILSLGKFKSYEGSYDSSIFVLSPEAEYNLNPYYLGFGYIYAKSAIDSPTNTDDSKTSTHLFKFYAGSRMDKFDAKLTINFGKSTDDYSDPTIIGDYYDKSKSILGEIIFPL